MYNSSCSRCSVSKVLVDTTICNSNSRGFPPLITFPILNLDIPERVPSDNKKVERDVRDSIGLKDRTGDDVDIMEGLK